MNLSEVNDRMRREYTSNGQELRAVYLILLIYVKYDD
jgi:hypothetical protein